MSASSDPRIRPLGIVAALPEELGGLLDDMHAAPDSRCVRLGMRDYYAGTLHGQACVLTLARVGKVAAAVTASALIHHFDVQGIVFTGVAGGVAPSVRVGDIVVARDALQHDMDASPFFARYEVPLLGCTRFVADPRLSARLARAAERFLAQHGSDRGRRACLHQGTIISGDRFVAGQEALAALRRELPDALAVEMEGAAIAQVCHEYGLPFAVIRAISDGADDAAAPDFARFVREVASVYAQGVMRQFLADVH